MLYNYRIIVSFDGYNYIGYQKQPNQSSVQGELEKALKQVCGNIEISLIGSGRTDAKVHALAMVLNFIIPKELDIYKVLYAANILLPDDIRINTLELVNDDFHSRYSALAKKYTYYVNDGLYDIFLRNQVWQLNKTIDLNLMKKGIPLFIGKHDFRTFSSAVSHKNTIREIYAINVYKTSKGIAITFYGNSFLRYMVRKLSIVLIELGLNKISLDEVETLLKQEDIAAYSKVAPGQGLYLDKVYYNKGDLDEELSKV